MNVPEERVVIVGAGPTGLALAAELLRLGVSSVVLDKQTEGENTSRACVIHARTLEVLEPLGVTAELIQRGVIIQTFRIRDRGRILATVRFNDLKTAYPFTLMYPQDHVEAVLLQRLRALGGAVDRPWEVNEVHQTENGIEVVARRGKETRTIHTQWAVGCDGAHSLVREAASIGFEGGAYDESFLLADVEMEWPIDRSEVTLFYSDQGLMVVAPLPENRFRIVAMVEHGAAQPSIADFESILQERGPEHGHPSIRHMNWSSRFHIQHRLATVLRRGNILLAGDAAHVHSPAGGQGMNTGIQDAISLASALNETLQTHDDTVLNKWQDSRLRIAHSVVDFTDQLTKVATLSSPVLKAVRNVAVELIGNIPFAQHAMAERLSELANK